LLGAKPADLPVEQPAKFGLVVNLIATTNVPGSVLGRAQGTILDPKGKAIAPPDRGAFCFSVNADLASAALPGFSYLAGFGCGASRLTSAAALSSRRPS
jgi:hypothetical protein